jgi:hypothetical protein
MPAATVLVALLLALAGAGRANAANFSVNYSPTGIAYDATSNLVSVSSGNQVNTYATNGTLLYSFIPTTGIFDLGAGASGTVWVANSSNADNVEYAGHGVNSVLIGSGVVALGRELWVGGTNWLLYAVSGGNVVAKNLADQSTRVLFATPANVTGGDWLLRPGGYALEHVLVGLSTGSFARFYYLNGTLHQSVTLDVGNFGSGRDLSFGLDEFWEAHADAGIGYAVSYPFTVPPVPEATVSVAASNGVAVVSWTGRWLEASANLQTWTALTNTTSPYTESFPNAPRFFRAVK